MAAAPQHSTQHGKHSNLVAQDMIWKAHVTKELETTKMWPETWGFLATPYNELKAEKIMEAKESAQQIKVPSHMKIRTVTPLEHYIKVEPSPALPKTTQGLIGWRSTIPALQLERYGRTQHFKGDFCKSMNWPGEGIA
ncbi:ciliary microtubule inner protein 1 isoform X1 [Engystomops pustulosus]|uniref:ciliary microtubule inner protein 1 isoform X1 n=1 Tax=Engystomops pustulosus TaxID=76066 RepID=UPI003AFA380C